MQKYSNNSFLHNDNNNKQRNLIWQKHKQFNQNMPFVYVLFIARGYFLMNIFSLKISCILFFKNLFLSSFPLRDVSKFFRFVIYHIWRIACTSYAYKTDAICKWNVKYNNHMLHEFRMLQKKNKNVSFKIFATAHSAKNSD